VRFLCVHNVCINIWVFLVWWNSAVSNSPAGGDSYLLPSNVVPHQHCASFDVLAAVWLRVVCLGYDAVSLNNQFRMFLRNNVPWECQELVTQALMVYPRRTELGTQWLVVYPRRTELGTQWLMWYITEEQNWVPSDSSGLSQENRTRYPVTRGISQENRTRYPVTHVVYPRRTELGTQWLMWYIPEEQNWVPSDSLGISQKNRTGYPHLCGISQKNKILKCQHSVIINYFDIALLNVDWSVLNKRKKLEAGRWWDAMFKLALINDAKENRNCTSSHCCAALIFQAPV